MSLTEKLEDTDRAQAAGTAVEPRRGTVRDLILQMEPQFRRALPQHVDAGRFVRLALTQLRLVPKLAECSPESVLAGLTRAAQLGLEIDADRGQAYLIPRKNSRTNTMEASFQVGYKGLIDLAGRGGITVRARDVREADLFEYEDGLEPKLRHVPELKKARGEAWAYFAVATFSDGRSEFVVMSKDEIEQHRDRFASAKSKGKIFGPWIDHPDAMARKTVIIRLLGTLPLPVEIAEKIDTALAVDIDLTPDELELDPPKTTAPEGGADETDTELEAGLAARHAEAVALYQDILKADPGGWKEFAQSNGIANDSREWTSDHVERVIAWITEQPEAGS